MGRRVGEASKEYEALSVPEKMAVLSEDRRGARGNRRRRGGSARALQRRVRVPLSEDRAPQTFRLAPGVRYRRLGREADRAVLREGMDQGTGRYIHARRAQQEN